MRPVNEIIVIVLDTILSEAIPQLLSKCVYLLLGFTKCITVVTAVLLAFLCLEKSIAGGQSTPGSRASLMPERRCFVGGQPRGPFGDHACS